MKISFVIPAYNEEKVIGQCLQSVFDEIDRVHDTGTKLDVEVVVVDNASTDATREEGLGTAIVNSLARQLHATVERETGQNGTTVFVKCAPKPQPAGESKVKTVVAK